MGLVPSPPGRVVGGEAIFNGRDLLKLDEDELRKMRGKEIAMIFQNPTTSLNPVLTIDQHMTEALMLHLKLDRAAARSRARELLQLVGIPDVANSIYNYPHQLSGGMQQRVMIAMGLSCNPRLLIADEPTTALDVTIQAQIISLMKQLRDQIGMSVIWITHDLAIIAGIADQVVVMYAGQVMETASVEDLYAHPGHPYTLGLLRALPRLDTGRSERLSPIPGVPPDLTNLPDGCPFAPRCRYRIDKCLTERPSPTLIGPRHYSACWLGPTRATGSGGRATMTRKAPSGSAQENNSNNGEVLLEVEDLKVHFPIFRGFPLRREVGAVKAVDGVGFHVRRGETLGLVGESGCGKTTIGLAVIKMYEPTAGSVSFDGQNLTHLRGKELRQVRRRMQMIFQDPYGSLNPRMTVDRIVGEPLEVHGLAQGAAKKERVQDLLKVVGLDPRVRTRYPHEFSGGERQRIGIARALASDPVLIVCDEPISALDASIQAQIINLLRDLQESFELTYLFIAHDLAVVRHISDRIAVMYLGKIVELAEGLELYRQPLHPYTQALLSAVPIPDPQVQKSREPAALKGEVPSPMQLPRGCRFSTRCPTAHDICFEEECALQEVESDHFVACHRVQ
jgi:peptide/nickel transport system ATP-binding protein